MDEIRVVAAVIVRAGHILLTQRTMGREFPLRWESPGGKLEPGEHPAAGLVRELGEEVSWHGQIDLEPMFATSFKRNEYGMTRDVQLAFYYARAHVDWRATLVDVEGAGWFDLEAMRQLPLTPGNKRLLEFFDRNGGIQEVL